MKKYIGILLAMLLLALPVTAMAAETVDSVRSMIEDLPTVEEFKAMDQEGQVDAYNRTQYAYDAYMALPSAEEKAQIERAEETFDALFSYFNTQIAPVETGKEGGNDLAWTVIAVLTAMLVVPVFRRQKTL